jgi:hypothetical protein
MMTTYELLWTGIRLHDQWQQEVNRYYQRAQELNTSVLERVCDYYESKVPKLCMILRDIGFPETHPVKYAAYRKRLKERTQKLY